MAPGLPRIAASGRWIGNGQKNCVSGPAGRRDGSDRDIALALSVTDRVGVGLGCTPIFLSYTVCSQRRCGEIERLPADGSLTVRVVGSNSAWLVPSRAKSEYESGVRMSSPDGAPLLHSKGMRGRGVAVGVACRGHHPTALPPRGWVRFHGDLGQNYSGGNRHPGGMLPARRFARLSSRTGAAAW